MWHSSLLDVLGLGTENAGPGKMSNTVIALGVFTKETAQEDAAGTKTSASRLRELD